jgi:hypothetical protein
MTSAIVSQVPLVPLVLKTWHQYTVELQILRRVASATPTFENQRFYYVAATKSTHVVSVAILAQAFSAFFSKASRDVRILLAGVRWHRGSSSLR